MNDKLAPRYLVVSREYKERGFDMTDDSFRYQMLARLQRDCEYYLDNGSRNIKHLHYLSVDDQITEMEKLYNSFTDSEKPHWLTIEQIRDYENRMKEA